MNFSENVSLVTYSTMGLGGSAAYLCDVTTRMEVLEALSWAQSKQLPVIMIGGGSNIIWQDQGFPGLVIINKILGYEVFEEDETNVYLTIGAGENWDNVVERSVASGLTGIESLSLIPGTAGGTPIQNVGAYGQDISQTLVTVQAFDTQQGDFVTIAGGDCGFSYRTSRFKDVDRGRFYLIGMTLHLSRGNPQPPYYSSVDQYFTDHGVASPTPKDHRDAVVAIRTAKLPDPAVVRNTGSFFGNPIIKDEKYLYLREGYESIPSWPAGEGMHKLSAAWLIDQAGFKDYHDSETGMATWPTQPLVLVNEHARSTADLLAFKKKIVDAVQAKFDVTLVQEPEML